MDKDKAIGIFDSGLGGLSVLRKLKQELPGEDIIFYGDQKHAPYGEKSEETYALCPSPPIVFYRKKG